MKQQRGLADDTSGVKATVLTVGRYSSPGVFPACPMAAVREDGVIVMCGKSKQLDR